jgi:hypothetical protein
MNKAALVITFVALVACGDDTTTSSGSGGSGTGGTSAGGTGAGAGTGTGTSTGTGSTTCADCGEDQICVTCNSAIGSPTHSCINKVADTATQFACGERVLCDNDTEVCVADTPPPGDNCGTTYQCNFFPSACDATPTCECITMYEPYMNADCTQLPNGQFQLDTGVF